MPRKNTAKISETSSRLCVCVQYNRGSVASSPVKHSTSNDISLFQYGHQISRYVSKVLNGFSYTARTHSLNHVRPRSRQFARIVQFVTEFFAKWTDFPKAFRTTGTNNFRLFRNYGITRWRAKQYVFVDAMREIKANCHLQRYTRLQTLTCIWNETLC